MMSNDVEVEIDGVLEEYPLYLLWSDLLALYARLGLGGKDMVIRDVRAGVVEKGVMRGKWNTYTRASVRRLAVQKSGKG